MIQQGFNTQIYLLDASARLFDFEDANYSSWRSFYSAVATSSSQLLSCIRLITESIKFRKSCEEADARLIFHSFMYLSDLFSRNHSDPRICAIPTEILKTRQTCIVTSGLGSGPHPSVDRLWGLTKSCRLDHPFSLNSVSKKILSVYPHREGLQAVHINDASISIQGELGMKFVECVLSSAEPNEIPESIKAYCSRMPVRFASECLNLQLEAIISELDIYLSESSSQASSLFLANVAKGLAISVPLKLGISTSRVLIRLAQFKQENNFVAEALAMLDEIDGIVGSNCSYLDLGIFQLTRAECLLMIHSTVSENCDEFIGLLCDAMRSLQLAIASFDRGYCTDKLLHCVITAAVVANKLQQSGMCNFYSVKYHQINAAKNMSSLGTRFFPADECDKSGQPKLPSELTQSPRPGKKEIGPLSPIGRGRGLQTLISWKINSGN